MTKNKYSSDNKNIIQKVVLIVNRERQGLIRSRIRGSVIAQGDTLMFLDSHCEMSTEWLEPLMQARV